MTSQTQPERVKAALLAHPQGVTQLDFDGPNVIDHGPPIKRLAARVLDLKAQGFPVIDGGWRQGCKVYKWDRERYLAERIGTQHQVSMDISEADFEAPKDTRERVTADGLRDLPGIEASTIETLSAYDPRSDWA